MFSLRLHLTPCALALSRLSVNTAADIVLQLKIVLGLAKAFAMLLLLVRIFLFIYFLLLKSFILL